MTVEENNAKAMQFMCTTAQRAFTELEKDLRKRGMIALVVPKGTSTTIHVARAGGLPTERGDLEWTVAVIVKASDVVAQVTGTSVRKHNVQRDGRTLSVGDITEQDVIDDFTQTYKTILSR